MSSPSQYELIDFGGGRKLERLGPWVLDRPCPTASETPCADPERWREATACYQGPRVGEGKWSPAARSWRPATIDLDVELPSAANLRLELAPLPSGQIGVFPEQRATWPWIARRVGTHSTDRAGAAGERLRVLNLFAYTGGSTLAAAAAGAEVTHVDAAPSSVSRARRNAAASGLEESPIRWIVEDAPKFCRRETRRGNRYDAVILDPPSYGHGPKGEPWSIRRDLLPLLRMCGELTEGRPKLAPLTCHTPGLGRAELSAYFAEGVFGHCGQPPKTDELSIESIDGRRLSSGILARWPR